MALDLGIWTIASVVVGFLVLIPSIMGLFGKNKFDVNGKVRRKPISSLYSLADNHQTVLVTGASEGMGRSVAVQLAQRGASVIIVARNVGKLEEALDLVKVGSSQN